MEDLEDVSRSAFCVPCSAFEEFEKFEEFEEFMGHLCLTDYSKNR